jgi:hypothetical protein
MKKITAEAGALYFTLISLVLILVFAVACNAAPNSVTITDGVQNTAPTPVPTQNFNIVPYTVLFNGGGGRFVDEEAGVVCYYIFGGTGVGIDCLPIGDTWLKVTGK